MPTVPATTNDRASAPAQAAPRIAVAAESDLHRSAIDHAPLSILRIDREGRIVYANDASCRMLGRDRAELCTLSITDIDPSVDERGWHAQWRRLEHEPSLTFETHHVAAGGSLLPVEVHTYRIEGGGEACVFRCATDMSDRRRASHRLHQLANFDELTGLVNRNALDAHLAIAIDAAKAGGDPLAVLFLDLDHFKLVNDSLGLAAGDAVLRATAERLSEAVPDAHTIARMGGDQFVVIVAGERAADEGAIEQVAASIAACLSQPVAVAGRTLHMACSIGVAMHARDGDTADALLRHADAALHSAKDAGRGVVRFFRPGTDTLAREWLELEPDLRRALDDDALDLAFQPEVDLGSGAIIAAEALLRWNHPRLGAVAPGRIVRVAEHSGLIDRLSTWVLRNACHACAKWHAAGLAKIRVSVNLSARQVASQRFVQWVRDALDASGLAPRYLELEVAESAFLRDSDRVRRDLGALRDLGIRLALDDFGTGYASLSYLVRYPVDTVKIDRSFLQPHGDAAGGGSIVRAIIHMAHALDLETVAVGVETAEQVDLLDSYQCDAMQGHAFSVPVDASALAAMLKEGRRLAREKSSLEAGRTVLLVDDEPSIIASLRRLLRQDRYRLLTAASGEEGLALLASEAVDVIVSDQRMPGMTGVEFLRRAKEVSPDTIRIVLSGFTELSSITDAINEGAIYRFLTKPWDDQQLRDHVREAVRSKGLLDDNRRLEHEVRIANRNLEAVNLELQDVLAHQRVAIEQGETSLDVAREIVDCIPVPIVGLDEDGLVVFTNREAERHIAGLAPALGAAGIEALPGPLHAVVQGAANDPVVAVDVNGASFRAVVRPMGTASRGRGRVVVLLPKEPS